MFGLSYHCGNCDGLASQLNASKCPTCGSTAVVPASWYQLSVDERSAWRERIHGRSPEVDPDPYRLDEPAIRAKVVLPPLMQCTAGAAREAAMSVRPEPRRGPSWMTRLWLKLSAWVRTERSAPPAVPAPLLHLRQLLQTRLDEA